MASQAMPSPQALHVAFVPFLAPGHMNPMVDMANLFSALGVTSTIITTPYNARLYQSSVEKDAKTGYCIQFQTVELPSEEVGLPKGIENLADITHPEMAKTVYEALMLTRDSMEKVIQEIKPDCIVGDIFYPWLTEISHQLSIPRVAFHGGNYFHRCAEHSLRLYAPHEAVGSDSESFMLPGLPHNIEMTRSQLPDWITAPGPMPEWVRQFVEADRINYGTVMNSFTELEPDYEDFSNNKLGVKSWSIGPVALFLKKDRAKHTNLVTDEDNEVIRWLNSKPHGSVIYMCFGTLIKITAAQIREAALGLESCGHNFILVVRQNLELEDKVKLPSGFEQRMKETGKGYIIDGWAPQLQILEHPATGAFVTHCGWNSILEGLCCGLPMITWPQSGEQLYNEKLVTDVLKIGVPVGVTHWSNWIEKSTPQLVTRDEVLTAIRFVMDNSDESRALRKHAAELANAAKKAVDSGGSSHANLMYMIDELKSLKRKTMRVNLTVQHI